MSSPREGEAVSRAPSAGNGGPQDGKGAGATPAPTGTLEAQLRIFAATLRTRWVI